MTDVFEKFVFEGRVKNIYEGVKKRLKPHDDREGTYTGFPDDGRTPFEDMFEKYSDEPYIIREAYGIVESWLVSEITFFEDDIIVGFPRPTRPVYEHFCRGITIEGGDERTERLAPEMVPFSYDEMIGRCEARVGGAEKYSVMADGLWWTGGYQGHTIPSYPKLLSMGLEGVRAQIIAYGARAEKAGENKKDFYRACLIIIEGLSRWIVMHAEKAAALAKDATGERREQYLTIEKTCRKVAHDKPETFLEAAQLMWFFCLWDWVDCVGRFDQYMYPFWRGEEDADTLTAIFLKFWEHGVHNMTVSGVDPETGEDATNEITYRVLRIMRTMHETHPRMTVRVHEGTPHDLWRLIVLMWSEGMSDPTIASDKNAIEGLVGYGVPLRDARDYSILGCQEIEIPGKSNFGCEDGSINLAKILEYTLFNGKDMAANGFRCGLDLGCLTDYKTFDDLWAAYVKEVEYLTELFCDCCNIGVDRRVANVSKLVKSTMTEACIERGLQHDAGGTIYNFGVVETCGHGAVGDSLYALKTLVYEQKKLTLEEVYEALLSNFEGHEDVRRMLLNAPKYGNNDDGADEMAARVLGQFWREIGKYKSRRGDVFTGACSLLGGGVEYGKSTWAMADGRRAGDPLGNSIGPRTGSDKNGLTAMLSSVARMPLKLGVGGSTCNVLIPTTIMATEEMREDIIALMKTFSQMGGQLAQITTAPLEDMKDAQIHPEAHEDLIVRIGGFSMRFIEFCREDQNEFIMRYSCGNC